MKRDETELDTYIESIKDRQSNLVWPDTMHNSRAVDEILWKGSRNAPLVQRIGIFIFAFVFVLAGLTVISMAIENKVWYLCALAAVIFMVAGRFIRNGMRK